MRDPHSITFGVRRLGRRFFVACVAFGWLLAMGFAQSVSAITLTAWDFFNSAGNEASVNSTPLLPAFQTTTITRGGFHDPIAVGGTLYNGSWPSIGTDGYFEFTISPAPGTTYSLTDVTFNIVAEADGPNTWYLQSDADGFAANLDSFTDFSSAFIHTSTLPGTPDFQSLTGPRIFRLYGLNATGGGAGLGGVAGDDLAINGTFTMASPVPETLPFGVFGLTAAALFWVRSRIKR